jgi:aryl carrier-like protein
VKISGYRIELGEIERVLAKNKLVSSVAVAVHDNTLCAYVVIKPTSGSEEELEARAFKELRALCQEQLTDYMMPKHFMVIEEIPLSSNGKIQREKLPKPEALSLSTMDGAGGDGVGSGAGIGGADIVAPSTPVQEKLLEIFSTVLRVPPSSISVTTNVFSIGLDSLRSLSIVTSARKAGLIISIPQVFDYPTIESLAEHTTTQEESGPAILGTGGGGVKESDYIFTIDRADIERTRRTFQTEAIQYPMIGINQAHYVGLYTSSFVKGSMTPQIYFEWEIGTPNAIPDPNMKGDINYNHRTQQVNVAALEFAINYFVNRHDTFRSIVRQDGQMEVYSTKDVPWYSVAAVTSAVGAADPEEALKATRKDMTTNGPKVFIWPLFEARVTHTTATSSVVHFTVSLFLMDAMSDLILRHELSVLYRAYMNSVFNSSRHMRLLTATPVNAAPVYKLFDECKQLSSKPKILFTDYCTALEGKLRCSRDYLAAKEFWSKRMFTLPAGPELPMLLSPAPGQENNTGRFSNFHRWLTVDEWRRTKANCAKYAVTIPAMLLAIYAIVLSHWSNKDVSLSPALRWVPAPYNGARGCVFKYLLLTFVC